MRDQKYILYIDDEENQLSFKALFRRKFPIFTVGDIPSAKQLIDKYDIKIVLSNQQFPAGVALELLRWIKQHDSQIVRVFICSAYDPTLQIEQIRTNNLAHQFLWKPWNTNEMEAMLLKWW